VDTKTIEVRCKGKGRLFFKIERDEVHIEENLICVKCRDCSKRETEKQRKPIAVFHRFSIVGDEVDTILKPE